MTGSNGVTGYYVLNTEKLSEAETRLAVKRLLAGEEGTGTLPENMTYPQIQPYLVKMAQGQEMR